jgi:heme/copper-type cytochrome/quinol oxidase subunit 4
MTLGECRKQIGEKGANTEEVAQCNEDYKAADKAYAKNFFIIASILGTIALIVAFYLFLHVTSLTITNICAGIACSGIVMVLWAFMRGWESTDEKLKFVVGLIIAVIIIILTVKLNRRMDKK